MQNVYNKLLRKKKNINREKNILAWKNVYYKGNIPNRSRNDVVISFFL